MTATRRRPGVCPRASSSFRRRSFPASCLDLRYDLGNDRANDLRHVVLDPDDAIPPPEHRVELRREADVARDGGDVLEVLHHLREGSSLRRAVGTPDRGDETVDRRRAGYEATRSGLHRLRKRVDRRARIVAETGRERDEPVIRHLRIVRQPIDAVTGPRAEYRGAVAKVAQA